MLYLRERRGEGSSNGPACSRTRRRADLDAMSERIGAYAYKTNAADADVRAEALVTLVFDSPRVGVRNI
jgi:hypothetical protein